MPNGNDKWSQFEVKDATGAGKWDEFEVKPTPAKTEIEKQAAFDSSIPAKLGRGLALGAAEGAGIAPTTDTSLFHGTEAQTAKQFGKGLFEAGKKVVLGPPAGDKEQQTEAAVMGPLGPVVGDIARGIESGGSEAWKGLKDKDPEAFAHGLGSMVTQVLMLGAGGKGAAADAAEVPGRTRLAKTASALDIGKGQVADLKTAMPKLVEQAQQAGISTVGEFGKKIKDASRVTDDKFNQGMQSFRNQSTLPTAISQRIRNLVTPDMAKTAEGRMQIKEIMARAREYDKPWTYNELNAKRRTENENLTAFYNRDTRAQAASPLDTDISKAIRDETADIVYRKWGQVNPGENATLLKQQQGALWALDDYINHRDKGLIAQLDAGQLQHEGASLADKVHARAAVHHGGVSAYLTGSLLAPFEEGPKAAASAKIAEAFPGRQKTLFKRVKAASLPIGALVGRQTPFDSSSTPPPDTPEASE